MKKEQKKLVSLMYRRTEGIQTLDLKQTNR